MEKLSSNQRVHIRDFLTKVFAWISDHKVKSRTWKKKEVDSSPKKLFVRKSMPIFTKNIYRRRLLLAKFRFRWKVANFNLEPLRHKVLHNTDTKNVVGFCPTFDMSPRKMSAKNNATILTLMVGRSMANGGTIFRYIGSIIKIPTCLELPHLFSSAQ